MGESGMYFPKITAADKSSTPIIVASATRPLRNLNIHTPMKRAMGMVEAIVKVPHDDSASAFTTTSPRPAIAITMMMNVATSVVILLVSFPVSALTISASDLPSWRIEAVSITMSCTDPAITAPTTIQTKPGK